MGSSSLFFGPFPKLSKTFAFSLADLFTQGCNRSFNGKEKEEIESVRADVCVCVFCVCVCVCVCVCLCVFVCVCVCV
jgi:hypothetical protein